MLLNLLPLGGVISFNRNDGKFKFDYANFTNNIFVYIQDMFIGGTVSSLLEWELTELIRHPNIMKKLQEEGRRVAKGRSHKMKMI
jgi:hypothetical protein